MEDNWMPLESNSEVLTNYAANIGFNTATFNFQDLLSLDEWAQEMIGQPCLGLLFVYPCTEAQEKHKAEETKRIEQEGQEVSPNLFYMLQVSQNACGSVGIFHILGNLPQEQKQLIAENSILAQFFQAVQGKSKAEAAQIFHNNQGLKQAHCQSTNEGQTNVQDYAEVNNHFIAFVQKDGHLYELDGNRGIPINRGPTTQETFLVNACACAKLFMERDPENLNFGTIVLAPPAPQEE